MLHIQAIRFLATGVLNTIVGYSLYALFLFLGLSYSIALGLATVIGVCFSFKTMGHLVFKRTENTLIFKFIAVYCCTFYVNLMLVKLGVSQGLNAYLAGLLAVVPTAALSFLLNKFFVFKR